MTRAAPADCQGKEEEEEKRKDSKVLATRLVRGRYKSGPSPTLIPC